MRRGATDFSERYKAVRDAHMEQLAYMGMPAEGSAEFVEADGCSRL